MIASEASGVLSTERGEKFRGFVGKPSTEISHKSLSCLQAMKKCIFLTDHHSFAIRFGLKFEALASLEQSGQTTPVLRASGVASAEWYGLSSGHSLQLSL